MNILPLPMDSAPFANSGGRSNPHAAWQQQEMMALQVGHWGWEQERERERVL